MHIFHSKHIRSNIYFLHFFIGLQNLELVFVHMGWKTDEQTTNVEVEIFTRLQRPLFPCIERAEKSNPWYKASNFQVLKILDFTKLWFFNPIFQLWKAIILLFQIQGRLDHPFLVELPHFLTFFFRILLPRLSRKISHLEIIDLGEWFQSSEKRLVSCEDF